MRTHIKHGIRIVANDVGSRMRPTGGSCETHVKLRFKSYADNDYEATKPAGPEREISESSARRDPYSDDSGCFGSLASGQTPAADAYQAASASSQPVTITLDEAIRRAQLNEPTYVAASASSRTSALDRSIARAALLPSVDYHNQLLYTQPNGLLNQAGQGAAAQPAPRFIANNAVREYASQAVINETVGLRPVGRGATCGCRFGTSCGGA